MRNNMKGLVLVQRRVAAVEVRPQPGEAPVTYGGLCMNCVHTRGCSFLRSADRPVIRCDEWSGEISAWETPQAQDAFEQPAARFTPTRARRHLPKGLCATCEEYPACTFVKPEGGVWHCEEYR